MIYITGETHNTIDMSHLSVKEIRKYCYWQQRDHKDITYAMVLGDFGLPLYNGSVDEDGIHSKMRDNEYLLNWYNKTIQDTCCHGKSGQSCKEAFIEDPNVRFNTKIDEMMTYKKWFFGHWHRDWGYDHRRESKYIPLHYDGVIVDGQKED